MLKYIQYDKMYNYSYYVIILYQNLLTNLLLTNLGLITFNT